MTKTQQAVILVAGVGSRLRPLTDDVPKALVPVGGKALLLRMLATLADYGVERIVLATGYREDKLRDAVDPLGLDVRFCRNPEYDSTQNSISLALCESGLAPGGFFKLDGDVVFAPAVLERLDAADGDLVAAVDTGRKLDAEAMKARVDADGAVVAFGKQLPVQSAWGESIGIERIGPAAVEPLFLALNRHREAGRTQLYYEDVYNDLVGSIAVRAVSMDGLWWTEIDDHDDLREAERVLSSAGD